MLTTPRWPVWNEDPLVPDDSAAKIFVTTDQFGSAILDVDLSLDDPITFISPPVGGFYSAWSPDDSRLVFSQTVPGKGRSGDNYQIVVVDVDGTPQEVLQEGKGVIWGPDWNPATP